MQRLLTLVFTLFFTQMLWAQTVADFENFNLPPGSFLNDAGSVGGAFTSGDISLPNTYFPQFFSWSGWAISNTTDTETPGPANESSSIAGSGAEGSATYSVSYQFGSSIMRLHHPSTVSGLYVTNTTYAYRSMLDGDAFSKKFGGVTGNDPDFFLLTIKKFSNGVLSGDSVNFYLADFRFSDNTQDYIVDEWTWLDLSGLGSADSLHFALSSSDVGAFGMNTPAYFAVDNVTTTEVVSVNDLQMNLAIDVFPNPVANVLTVNLPQENAAAWIQILDRQGKTVAEKKTASAQERFDVQALPAGSYFVRVMQGGKVGVRTFVKHHE